ncbi:hypothetical protein CEV31_1940 [Brucella thiophenivorans]|uniref:Uncharacterized protein n=1 Tax=Brucella thiophenivorans TaxID=571255 RepID=A0A256FX90_9HYPH|nr:hypothetical protein CEV31_1940 [Brucella thiophenivorans]
MKIALEGVNITTNHFTSLAIFFDRKMISTTILSAFIRANDGF